MSSRRTVEATILGALLCLGLALLGIFLANGVLKTKELGRTVTVKGLSEQEVPADIAIWPISFSEADNDLSKLYSAVESKTGIIVSFLKKHGFTDDEITISAPSIIDRQASRYDSSQSIKYRYTGKSTVSIYSLKVELVRSTMNKLVDLGKQGIAIGGEDYETKTQFLFTKLNDIKPKMIEEATKNAREVAEKFAKDSNSKLGKIYRAQQGQFSIEERDKNTPHIKKIRIVSTIEYYLTD